jgi:hypothetical protein
MTGDVGIAMIREAPRSVEVLVRAVWPSSTQCFLFAIPLVRKVVDKTVVRDIIRLSLQSSIVVEIPAVLLTMKTPFKYLSKNFSLNFGTSLLNFASSMFRDGQNVGVGFIRPAGSINRAPTDAGSSPYSMLMNIK